MCDSGLMPFSIPFSIELGDDLLKMSDADNADADVRPRGKFADFNVSS